MNIYAVPMLISGILCAMLAMVTWLFRRRERINRVFSFFTLALAVDAFAFFSWFQFGSVENIDTWMRITFTAGFVVPLGLIFFFFAFTGYDRKMNEKVLGIKAGHFQIAVLLFIFICTLLSQFSSLIIDISHTPEHIWDMELGPLGLLMFPIYAGIFIYLFTMAFKSYAATENKPQKRFILLISLGTLMWLLFGYAGALVVPVASQVWSAISYLGTGMMAVFYFVAIVNYQSDQVNDLNLSLEGKVAARTRELQQKNLELAVTLEQLKEMQKQVIVQEKMASLGQLVAGLTHEFNTPIGAIRSMKNTKSKALIRLQGSLEKAVPEGNGQETEFRNVLEIVLKADQLIDQGVERIHEIIKNLKNFARLDEAETTMADIHECMDSVLALIGSDLLTNIEVVREYSEIPPFVCQPRKLNQAFLNILKNACEAMAGDGKITITTSLKEDLVHVAIRDTGTGIQPADLKSIFDPGFTRKGSVVRARLGLSTCYQIVQDHQGKITIDSQPGKGSVFTIVLPTTLPGVAGSSLQ